MILAGFAMQAQAYDFQAGNLLYTIISAAPPQVSVDGHVDGTNAQGELIIPASVEHQGVAYEVKSIRNEAFWHCSGLTGTLVLPETLSEICEMAFADCTGLTGALDLPQSLTKIKHGAFFNCSGLTGDLVIPDSVSEVGTAEISSYYNGFGGAFAYCTGFTHLDLPEAATIIGIRCFEGCTQLSGQLEMPNTIREIQQAAFLNCTGLSGTLTLSNAIESIGKEAFSHCTGFTGTLVIPETVREMGWEAFSFCTGIEDVVFPESPITQGGAAFLGCTGLTDIDIPESWTTMRALTFKQCSNLVRIHLPNGMTNIEGSAFDRCVSLSEINWPDSLKDIYPAAFRHCHSLHGALELPKGLERISEYAFDSCSGYDALVLGDSLKLIHGCFANTNFKAVTLKAIVPPMLLYIFNDPQNAFWERDILIIVPCGTIEAYRAADNWRDFTNMREAGVDYAFHAASEDEEKGEVNILKEATCDDWNVEVEAIPSAGHDFLYWDCDGEVVSYDNPFRFVLEANTYLVARFSGPEATDERSAWIGFYPNPTKGIINIPLDQAFSHETRIQIFDAKGAKCLDSGIGDSGNLTTLDVHNLDAGIYVYKVVSGKRELASGKFVKE